MKPTVITSSQLRWVYGLSLFLLVLLFAADLLNTRAQRLHELEQRLDNGTFLLAKILSREPVVSQLTLDDIMENIRLGVHAQIMVIDSSLNVIAHSRSAAQDPKVVLDESMIRAMLADDERHPAITIRSADGITRMAKLNHIPGQFVYVVVSDSVTQSMSIYYRRMGVYALLFVLAAAIGYLLLNIQLRLLRSETRFRTMIDDFTDIPIQGFSPDGTVVYWNKASAEMYGHSAEEMIGRPIDDIIDTEQNRISLKRILDTLFRTKQETAPIRWTLTNKNGEPVEAVSYFSLLADSRGKHEVFCIDVNVGELVKAQRRIQDLLDEKETILREVHHRIKNNMNTIAGMLWLQADTMKDKTAAQALLDAQGRIMNMMVLYNKLFRSAQFTTLSVKEFIEDMITHIRITQDPSERIQLHVSIEDAQIDSKKLQTVGMIINELMTNVYKYAFPLGAEGEVRLSIRYPEPGLLHLEIQDSGKGLPESILNHTENDGFGMMLIRMLSEQLGATYEIRNDQGACFTFRIPI